VAISEPVPLEDECRPEHPSTWRSLAACQGFPLDSFFPEGAGAKVSAEVREACQRCPVQPQCLDWAVHFEHDGFWAGTGSYQRKQLRLKLGIELPRGQWLPD